MADNVNIIVQDTINDIVVNAAVVVETIDINVQAAVDVVDIVANPNNYVVNINRIIGEQVQSDWTQTDNQAPDYIKNKPTIPAAQVNSDWDATSGVAEILNKPTIPTNTSDLVNDGENGVDPFITAADIPPVTGFVPYTGATEDVNLGEFGLLTGNIEFDNIPTNIPTTAGAMYWNDSDGTADLILKGGNVKLQIGQESVIRVVNKTATNINLLEANYQAVRVTGAQGQRLKVDLAQATTDNLSAETIGLVTETINNNQEGFITTSGLVRNINTTGSLQGETWADGDILYLSPTTAGNITKVKPTAPNHLVIVGYVVHAHANQGSIFVKVDNGYELDELHNVKITSAANNNVLAYTSATDIWENKTVETALGFTPENVANKSTSTSLGTSNTLYPTQNAVKVYADTKFTLPALTSGSVLFSDGTTIAQKNANFFWDNTNNRLGIGTNAPVTSLQIVGTNELISIGDGLNASSSFCSFNNRAYFGFRASVGATISTGAARALVFGTGTFASLTEWARFAPTTGNLLLNTTTDGGFKLDVNGTARVQGNLTMSNFTTITSGSNYTSYETFRTIFGATFNTINNQYAFNFDDGGGNSTLTSGTTGRFQLGSRFAPTSGTAVYNTFLLNATINQTGGANGITRGLYINPTLTSAFDFRAIENSVGKVCLNTTSGNTMIGTTTDAGYKLDVNGNSRVKGAGATDSTNAFIVQNSAGNNALSVANGLTTIVHQDLQLGNTVLYWNGGTQIRNISNGVLRITNSSNSDFTRLQFGGGTTSFPSLQRSGAALCVVDGTGTFLSSLLVGTTTDIASSKLTVESTTQGFLPPRMTTTQKNAIATPAAGLVVYDTTDNKHYGYNGTTWNAFY